MAEPPAVAETGGQGVRFVLNGLVATGTHYVGLLVLADALGLRPVGLANFFAAALGVAVSYVGNHHFVFRSTRRKRETVWRFLGVYGLMTLLHGLAMYAWADLAGLPKTPGFVLITGGTAAANFVLGKLWVFTRSAGDG